MIREIIAGASLLVVGVIALVVMTIGSGESSQQVTPTPTIVVTVTATPEKEKDGVGGNAGLLDDEGSSGGLWLLLGFAAIAGAAVAGRQLVNRR